MTSKEKAPLSPDSFRGRALEAIMSQGGVDEEDVIMASESVADSRGVAIATGLRYGDVTIAIVDANEEDARVIYLDPRETNLLRAALSLEQARRDLSQRTTGVVHVTYYLIAIGALGLLVFSLLAVAWSSDSE